VKGEACSNNKLIYAREIMKKIIKVFQFFIVLLTGLLLTACDNYYSVTIEPEENIIVEENVNLKKVLEKSKLTLKVIVPEGKEVDEFIIDDEVKELHDLKYVLTVVKDHIVRVTFKDQVPLNKASLTLGDGLSADVTDLTQVEIGSQVTINVTVPEGKEVDEFTVDGEVKELQNLKYVLTIVKDHIVKVTFKDQVIISKVSLTLGDGLTADVADLTQVEIGSQVTISVTVPEGKEVDEFTIDGVKTTLRSDNTYSLRVTGNHVLTVTFKEIPPQVFVEFDLNGGVAVNFFTIINIDKGSTLSEPQTIPTKEGYTFVEWRLNNVKYDFSTVVNSDIILVAHYKINNYEVKFVVDGVVVKQFEATYGDYIAKENLEPKDGLDGAWLLNGVEFDFDLQTVTSDMEFHAYYGKRMTASVEVVGNLVNITFTENIGFIADIDFKNLLLQSVLEQNNVLNINSFNLEQITISTTEKTLSLTVHEGFIYSNHFRSYDNSQGKANGVLRMILNLNKSGIYSTETGMFLDPNLSESFVLKLSVPFDAAQHKPDYNQLVIAEFFTLAGAENDKVNDPIVKHHVKFVSEDINLEQTVPVYHQTAVTRPLNPVREGFVFLGWFSNDELFDFNTIIENDTILEAKWGDPNSEIFVEFDTKSPFKIDPQILQKGDNAVMPEPISLINYDFIGWQLNGETYDFNTPVEHYIKLTAKWQLKTITVTFNLDGGTGITEMEMPYGTTTYWHQLAEQIEIPTKEGYIFGGYKQMRENQVLYAYEPITLDVIWLQNIAVTFDYMYDNKTEVINLTNDIMALLFSMERYQFSKEINFIPKRPGYKFDGWYSDPNFVVPILISRGIVSNKYYAKWVALDPNTTTYTITFDSQGGTPVNPVIAISGERINYTLEEPTKPGYNFGGWYSDKECRVSFNTNDYYFDSDITLYASWVNENEESQIITGETVTITFVTNMPFSIAPVKVLKGVPNPYQYDIPDEWANLKGYRFMGWVTENDETPPYIFNTDTTLYAKWVKYFRINGLLNGKLVYAQYVSSRNLNDSIFEPNISRFYDVFYDEALTIGLKDSPIYNEKITQDITIYLKEKQKGDISAIDYVIKVGNEEIVTVNKMYSTMVSKLELGVALGEWLKAYRTENKIFDGLYFDQDCREHFYPSEQDNYVVDGKLYLYIKLTDIFYIPVIHSEGNTKFVPIRPNGNFNELYSELSQMEKTRENYTFEGFYLDQEYTRNISELVGKTIQGGTVIYMKWIPVERIIINLDTNGVLPIIKKDVTGQGLYVNFNGYKVKGIYYDKNHTQPVDTQNTEFTNGQTIYVDIVKKFVVYIYADESKKTRFGTHEIVEGKVLSDLLPTQGLYNRKIIGWKLNGVEFDTNIPFTGEGIYYYLTPIYEIIE